MSLQVVATGGEEHIGSLSDCSTFVFTSLRLVLSCAVDLFSSFKVLFTFNKASLVSLIAVGTHLASEQMDPPGRQWKPVLIYKVPSGNSRWAYNEHWEATRGACQGNTGTLLASSPSSHSQLCFPTLGLFGQEGARTSPGMQEGRQGAALSGRHRNSHGRKRCRTPSITQA